MPDHALVADSGLTVEQITHLLGADTPAHAASILGGLAGEHRAAGRAAAAERIDAIADALDR